jgi:hypothetical protein
MKSSQLEHDQMFLLCIHIEYILVHDSIRWDLTRPQPISPTNWSYATCKGASSRAEAARAALVLRGRHELCRGRSWVSHEHTGHAMRLGHYARPRRTGSPCRLATPGRTTQRRGQATRAGRHGQRPFARHAGDTAGWPRCVCREPARRVWSGRAAAPGRHAGVPALEPHAHAGATRRATLAPRPRPRRVTPAPGRFGREARGEVGRGEWRAPCDMGVRA